MRRLLRMIVTIIAFIAFLAPVALAKPPLYFQVAGGEEEHVVPAKETLDSLALQKGLRLWVIIHQARLQKPFELHEGMSFKLNNAHIVPNELNNGLVINLPELMLYHIQYGNYQGRYGLAVGKPSWPTPTGSYKIVNKRRNPTWNVPPSIQEEMEDMGQEVLEKVPPGPKNPLGAYWLGTSAEGVGIHATNRPWSVGYSVSHGCIRMLPKEIAKLFPQIEVGTPVKIIYRPVKLALTPRGRTWLEAHPNIYHEDLNSLDYVKELAQAYNLTDRIDWRKVRTVLKIQEGVAHDVTKEPASPVPAAPRAGTSPREVKLTPLQGLPTKVE